MAVLGLACYVSISEGRRKRKQSWWDLGKGPRSHLSGEAGITRESAVPKTAKAAAVVWVTSQDRPPVGLV